VSRNSERVPPRVLRVARVALRGLALVVALAVLAAGVAVALTPLPAALAMRGPAGTRGAQARGEGSIRVTDRDGNTLREARADDGAKAQWLPLEEMGPLPPEVLLAAEDRRFFAHPGVDPIALARAVLADLYARHVVSGGSTITMQLARTVRPHPRTLFGKLGEMIVALRIEASLSKREILEQYLNRVSFGPGLRGVAAASQAYFDKPPRALGVSEVALVVGLARGPSYYELTRHADRAIARRNRVLDRMQAVGAIAPDTASRARSEPVALQKRLAAFGAPHFVRGLLDGSLASVQAGLRARLGNALAEPVTAIETTIDSSLQRTAEAAAEQAIAALGPKHVTAAAALVVDNESGDVLAYVGSPDFFDAERGGQNDGVRAERQPGSTLKPFVYGLAMDRLGFTGATVLPDVELHLRAGAFDYAPHDYDERFRGPVRLREALGNSLNVPAVWTAAQTGETALLDRLRALGFDSLRQAPEYYGPGLALGDGEVTLLSLVRAYASLARDGRALSLRVVRAIRPAGEGGDALHALGAGAGADDGSAAAGVRDGDPVLDHVTSAEITDILRDHGARRSSFGERTLLDFDFDVAVKTGTSKGSRDNWVLGYTRAVTVGVWVGNFDGSPMNGTSGITGAGPLFHAVMEAAMRGRRDLPLAIEAQGTPGEPGARSAGGLERVAVCALSGMAPGPACTHRVYEWMPPEAKAALAPCSFHARVRVDRANGLLAGPACGAGDVAMRDVEVYPPEYAEWASEAGRPVVRETSPRCPIAGDRAPAEAGDGDALRIARVMDGARFALDPETPPALQRLDVTVVAPSSVHTVRLRVDGNVVGERGAPYAFAWPLEEGEHVLVAEADGAMNSPPVRVHVRGL
jgi:penicillin-binding protein 1C